MKAALILCAVIAGLTAFFALVLWAIYRIWMRNDIYWTEEELEKYFNREKGLKDEDRQ